MSRSRSPTATSTSTFPRSTTFVEFTPPPLERGDFDTIVETIADETRREGWKQLADELPSVRVLSSIRAVIPALAPADVRGLLGMGAAHARGGADRRASARSHRRRRHDPGRRRRAVEKRRALRRVRGQEAPRHPHRARMAGAGADVARRHRRWQPQGESTPARASPQPGPAAIRPTSRSSRTIRTSSCTTRSTCCTRAR